MTYNARKLLQRAKPLSPKQWYALRRCGVDYDVEIDNQSFYNQVMDYPKSYFGDMNVYKNKKYFSHQQRCFFEKHGINNYQGMTFADAEAVIDEFLVQNNDEQYLKTVKAYKNGDTQYHD